jgi:tRNA(fMet)-specific endonuclease VapC
MILLDTDIMTLWLTGHPVVDKRVLETPDLVATTVVSRIELLGGRFEYLLKANDGAQIQVAQSRLDQTERQLAGLVVVPFDAGSAAEFDRLRRIKKLKRIGRADLLIASIALAHRAILVTRNLRHFREISGLILENWAD